MDSITLQKWFVLDVMFSLLSFISNGPMLAYIMLSSCSGVPLVQKAAKFGIARLKASKHGCNLEICTNMSFMVIISYAH